ncbi:MAG: Gfo/Idh/MocA family oxidoreductase, partial [Dehalococcoidia bacterium]|nr:Gfo/Idh/MocA family oxidoreductase [Dehalococcoidia bacterium]
MRIGLIGCGEIARRGHLPALSVLKDFKVVALADQDKDRVQRVAREFGIAKTYTTARDLVEDKTVEAVVATVPPQAYKDIVSLAASLGKPVLVEKPVALNTNDALFIAQKVKESGIKLGVVQNYRYFPALQEIKKR